MDKNKVEPKKADLKATSNPSPIAGNQASKAPESKTVSK
jgi:hypothetical protein